MESEWTLKKIGEFAEVRGGKRLPKGKKLSEKKTTHPYIRVVDFSDGRISLSNLLYVPEEVFPSIKRYIVESGDLVISIVGTIGLVAIIPFELHEANLTENAAKILFEEATIDPQFLSWYLKSSIGKHEIQRNTVGSTQPKLPLYGIKNIEVNYPPLPEQRAIAHILGSLDDKIELNRRTNETLEAMARAIFKSWFVDFDPVRAKAEGRPTGLPDDIAALFPDSFEDSELGEIPKGWEVRRLSEISKKPQYGYNASANEEVVGPKFLRIKDINKFDWIDWTTVPYCEIEERNTAKYSLQTGDIVIARMADPGHAALIEEPVYAVFASYLIRFRPLYEVYDRYLQYWLRSDEYWKLVRGHQTGSTRANLNAKVLGDFSVLVPDVEIAISFRSYIKPIRDKILSNIRESNTLASLRDTLLPKLISGELRVPNAEKFIEEAEV